MTKAAGLAIEMFAIGVTAADYDNDGWEDLYVTAIGGNRLFRNLGNGTFADVTAKAGTKGPGTFGTSAMFFDYDKDGKLDLFVANYVKWTVEKDLFCTLDGKTKSYCTPESYKGESPTLFRNRGDGTFEDVTEKAGLWDPTSKALGVALLDHDDDGWPDFVLANDTQPNKLYRNNRDGTFTDVGTTAGIAFGETGVARAGMGVDAADYYGSGRPSLLFANFSNEMIGLYHNEGNGLFVDEAPASTIGRVSMLTLAFGFFFFDYDLDGRLDIFAGNGHVADDINAVQPRVTYAQPPHVFRNVGDRRFEAVTSRLGPAMQRPIVARGAACGDFDNDGDLDVVVNANNGPARPLPQRRRQPEPLPAREDDRDEVEPRRHRRARDDHAPRRHEAVAARPHRLELLLAERHRADVRPRRERARAVDRGRVAERAGRPHRPGRGEPGGLRPGRPRAPRGEAAAAEGRAARSLSRGGSAAENRRIMRPLRSSILPVCLAVAAALSPLPCACGAGAGRAPPRLRPPRARPPGAQNNVGVALLEQFRFAEAAETFKKALATDPTLHAARVNLAIALPLRARHPRGARRRPRRP